MVEQHVTEAHLVGTYWKRRNSYKKGREIRSISNLLRRRVLAFFFVIFMSMTTCDNGTCPVRQSPASVFADGSTNFLFAHRFLFHRMCVAKITPFLYRFTRCLRRFFTRITRTCLCHILRQCCSHFYVVFGTKLRDAFDVCSDNLNGDNRAWQPRFSLKYWRAKIKEKRKRLFASVCTDFFVIQFTFKLVHQRVIVRSPHGTDFSLYDRYTCSNNRFISTDENVVCQWNRMKSANFLSKQQISKIKIFRYCFFIIEEIWPLHGVPDLALWECDDDVNSRYRETFKLLTHTICYVLRIQFAFKLPNYYFLRSKGPLAGHCPQPLR